MTAAQWKESRKIILACVLGTDMVHHVEQVSKAQVRYNCPTVAMCVCSGDVCLYNYIKL